MNNNDFLYDIYKSRTKGLIDDEMSRCLYILLGKRTIYNENFYYGNSYEQANIYYAEPEIYTDNGTNIAICNVICKNYKKLMNMCDIKCEIETETSNNFFDNYNIYHQYNIVHTNDKKYKVDLTKDLYRIHCGLRPRHFTCNKGTIENPYTVFSEDALCEFDKKINYYNESYGYSNEILNNIENTAKKGDFSIDEKLNFLFRNISKYINFKTMGPS